MVQLRDDIVGLDAAVIMSPKVWEASGHLEVFHDPLVECLTCHQRFREDHLPTPRRVVSQLRRDTGFTDPRTFNLMFKTHMGPVEDDDEHRLPAARDRAGDVRRLHARPDGLPQEVPFGIAQIGKSFRNEITPGNFIFRMREFEQMEMEFFVEPGTDEEWHEYWIEAATCSGTSTSGSSRSTCGCASTTPTSSATTRSGPSTSSTRSH